MNPEDQQTQPVVDPQQAHKAQLVDVLAANPKTRNKLLALVKEHNPDVRIPEVDMPQEIRDQAVKPLEDKIQALEAELTKDRVERRTAKDRATAMDMGLREDELPEVDKVMTERGIGDYKTAAEFYSKVVKPVAAPRSAPPTLDMPNMKGLFSNTNQWARNEAYKVLAEIQATKGLR